MSKKLNLIKKTNENDTDVELAEKCHHIELQTN